MRINEKTKIVGEKVILVPYESHHVMKYHSWMEDAELRRMTGSERLTLEEEYQMQRNWREDDDKCTFILLSRALMESGSDEIAAMIGDVNVFICDGTAEVELMVAEPKFRGQGIGSEAMELMIKYAFDVLQIGNFQAKIVEDNFGSLKLFQKLGFELEAYSNVFKEYTYYLKPSELKQLIISRYLTIQAYEPVL